MQPKWLYRTGGLGAKQKLSHQAISVSTWGQSVSQNIWLHDRYGSKTSLDTVYCKILTRGRAKIIIQIGNMLKDGW